MSEFNLSHLKQLEAESIHIIREVAAEFDNPVMLYSAGKDSSVMLHLAHKAFYPGKIPFPLMHVDTQWKFKEMYKYGILHDDANSLIKQLQKIQNNPYKWWSNRLLSKKRKVFCNHFIKTDINSTMLLKTLNNIKL